MPVFNVGAAFCGTNRNVDIETGCVQVGCEGSDRTAYESCRQAFYLKKQTEISQENLQQSLIISSDTEQKIEELKLYNTNLEEIIEQQNQQITLLVENSNVVSNKIEKLNLSNILLISILGVSILIFMTIKFINKIKGKNSQ